MEGEIMEISNWVPNDGYYEAVIRLRPDTEPILRLRTVTNGDGSFSAVVRDYSSGVMIDRRDRYNSIRDAEICGLNLVRDILAGSLRAVYGPAKTKDFLEGWKEFHPGPLPEIIIGD